MLLPRDRVRGAAPNVVRGLSRAARLAAAALVVVALLAAAACGSDDDSGAPVAGDPSQTGEELVREYMSLLEAQDIEGLDSLLSIVQMPGGVPVGTLGIGKPGAINAGLLAARILARSDEAIAAAVAAFVDEQAAKVLATGDPREGS